MPHCDSPLKHSKVSGSKYYTVFAIVRIWITSLYSEAFLNTLGPRQNGWHFADDVFKRMSFNENVWISIKMSPKFVPRGPISKIPALFQIMAWRRPGDKPLSEAMLVASLGLNELILVSGMIKDLSMMYRALWDRRHEGATRISQCTRRVAPSALTYPSGPWVPPISQCTIHHA